LLGPTFVILVRNMEIPSSVAIKNLHHTTTREKKERERGREQRGRDKAECLEFASFFLLSFSQFNMPPSALNHAIQNGTTQDLIRELARNRKKNVRVNHKILMDVICREDGAEKIQALLSNNTLDIETCQGLLSHAIAHQRTSAVGVLLSHAGINPNFFTTEYTIAQTPLHIAVCAEAIDIVTLLLDHNVDIEIRDCAGNTALHYHTNHLVVRKLIKYGANPNQVNHHGYTPFHNVCNDGDLASAQEMHHANPNFVANGETPLHRACAQGHWHIVRWLIQEVKANPIPRTKQPLFHIVAPSLSPSRLIGLGLDPWQTDTEGNTALHNAVTQFVEEDGAIWAHFIDELVAHTPGLIEKKNHAGMTALHVAANLGNNKVIQLLVDRHQGDLMAKDNYGRTPAFEALLRCPDAQCFHWILNLMVSKQLDVNCKDNDGWTLLHHAVFQDYATETHMLIDNGVNCDIPNNRGRLALHMVGFPHSGETDDPSNQRNSSTYTDHDIEGVLRSGVFALASENAQIQESDVQLLWKLIHGTKDLLISDNDGNLPFFLAAASSKLDQTFVMVQSAVSQGLCCHTSRDSQQIHCVDMLEERPHKKCKKDMGIILDRSCLRVGDRIAVEWPLDNEFYSGEITQLDYRGGFEILYDDGYSEWPDNDESLLIKRVNDIETLNQKKQDVANLHVGDRLEVWWPIERAFYDCTISQINHSSNKPFYLDYDDGDREWTNLLSRTYNRVLE